MDLDDVRAFATSLPEVDEKPHFARPAFRVRDKLFVSVHSEHDASTYLVVHVGQGDAAAAVAENAGGGAFEEVWRSHGGKRIFVGLRVELAMVSDVRCRELIEQAWRNRAPKRLVAAYDG